MKRTLLALGLLLAAALPWSCAQNNPDAPPIGGYSTGLVIVNVTAIPDVLPADGLSTSQLRLEAMTRDLKPMPGRAIAFFIVNVQNSGIPGLDPSIQLRYCPLLSDIGTVTISTDVTDENGLAWGEFRAGTGQVYAEEPDSDYDPNQPPPDPCLLSSGYTKHSPVMMWTVVRGKITDPRETESEFEIQDDVVMEMYTY